MSTMSPLPLVVPKEALVSKITIYLAIVLIFAKIIVSLARMTNVEIILDYATAHGRTIARKEFVPWYESAYPNGSVRSMDTVLRQMVASGLLERIGYGQFRMSPDAKPSYIPPISPEMKELFLGINEKYPYAKLCVWQARTLSSFMQHIPSIDMLILETDRIAAEAVYEDMRNLAKDRMVLLRPTAQEIRLYASGTPSVLVKNYISESPVISIDGVTTASLEKILVDITIAPEFEFARGAELYTIFENADQMYRIGKKTMLRYAARRGKQEEIEKLIKSTMR